MPGFNFVQILCLYSCVKIGLWYLLWMPITANLGQAFLSRVPGSSLDCKFPNYPCNFEKIACKFLEEYCNFPQSIKSSSLPVRSSSLPVIPRVLTSCVKVLTYIGLTNSYFFYYNSQRQMNEFCCSGWILLLIYKEYLSPHFVAKFICLADRDGQSNRFILKM